ncbi:hypothetical protein EDC94DRAFT_47219 [Helicostylum pulchrum]|nr:hypothetical protein EDC94DRAFT_47219 [Helicostylum pulchrum]
MSTNFWGHRMVPGESYPIKYKGILTLNQASLEADPVEGKTWLKVKAKGHTFMLCSLVKDEVERQVLSHFFIKEDDATLILCGTNPVNLVGSLLNDNSPDASGGSGDEEEDETVSGQPRYAEYLSDLLGPDLPEDDDEDYLDDEEDEEDADNYGSLAFRDPNDNEYLGGFELRHFNLGPKIPGYDNINLRKEEKDDQDTQLNDNIAKGLVNALLNSGDKPQIKKGNEFLKKLKQQQRKKK